jgi:hypothetical protein
MWPLFSWSAWVQPPNVVVGTTGEGVDLTSVLWVGMGSANHCGAGATSEVGVLASVSSFGVGSASQCGCGYDR